MATQKDNNFLTPTKSRPSFSTRPEPRRLSSLTARPVDLYSGNVTVAPDRHLSRPSDAHETALALERAKSRLAEEVGELTPEEAGELTTDETGGLTPDDSAGPATPEDGALETTDRYAFAFDIDGVLIKGGDVIPGAVEAMKMLNGQNEYEIKV